MTNIADRIDRIESHLAVQQLAYRYARALDSRDIDALGDLFAPQTNFGEDGLGPQGGRTFYRRILTDFYRSFHQVSGQVLDFKGPDLAHGTVYCRAEHEVGDRWILNLMVYFDRYVRVDGQWCFLGRRPRYLYVGDAHHPPAEVAFNKWPGRDGAFEVELPQSDPSWAAYWAQWPDEKAQRTAFP